jgi:GNAT superfamily N-acetyltransferase
MARRVMKKIAGAIFGAYRFNRIYRLDGGIGNPVLPVLPNNVVCARIESTPLAVAEHKLLDRIESYGGEDAHGFGLFLEGRLISSCWFWGHERFRDPLLWKLEPGDVIMVDLVTATAFRGRNFASLLISYAGAAMRQAGFRRMYTWVWHSHYASYHAFEKAGWRHIAWVLQYQLPFAKRPRRVRWAPLLQGRTKGS